MVIGDVHQCSPMFKLLLDVHQCFLLNIVYFSVCLTSNKLYWIDDQLADVSTRFYTSASWRRRVGPSASWLVTLWPQKSKVNGVSNEFGNQGKGMIAAQKIQPSIRGCGFFAKIFQLKNHYQIITKSFHDMKEESILMLPLLFYS